MAEKWINFKELRERLNVSEILASYNVTVKVKGDQAQGFCPLPGHPTHDGKKKSPSFSVNLKRGIFQCFSCRATGNCIDLVCLLEGMNPKIPGDIRKTALLLDEWFPANDMGRIPAKPKPQSAAKAPSTGERKLIVNAPLDFELKHLDFDHPYLQGRGFNRETIEYFGLGFCCKGLMKDRIVIPLHDAAGTLIGYAGRVIDDTLINEDNPRYRFPSSRERDGTWYEFRKSLFLYNGFAVADNLPELTVVESFTATWWLMQHQITNVVSVMGAHCSREQGSLIANKTAPDALVTILTDGDEAGIECAKSIFAEVAPHRMVRWAQLSKERQPTDCSEEELHILLLASH